MDEKNDDAGGPYGPKYQPRPFGRGQENTDMVEEDK
jgi:hypothetical protein